MRLVLNAYAKINLYLEVVGKRPDGYHDLVTVMQSISLADELTLERQQAEGISLTIDGDFPTNENNLVVRAANAYFAASGTPFGVNIHLKKQIPVSAGLGGGSADAAATLQGLNTLNGGYFDQQALLRIAAGIGADVPFCLVGGTKLCRGIGEQMTPAPSTLSLTLVVAKSGEGVSTPAAFAALDRAFDDFRNFDRDTVPEALLAGLANGDISRTVSGLFNRFESVIEPARPSVTALKRELLARGALAAQMSGSGPAVFGIFADAAAAKAAAEALRKMGNPAFACQTVQEIS
ncbi:MAG: 4-(cytidine 5'-diphospho)-2-C-methyl-D-erythritol kinase [Ruminococcaceae bacterium]|nr:4-(cytidine 5'-diphospho)-2-C-methyl-D-erythritol kinase [Oscillospiraceae bacterium]